jgi:hypothetical protein
MGQAKKLGRNCPAAGQTITPAECGAGRVTKYACPIDCPFNPWRPDAYDELLAIHDRLDAKVFPRLGQDLRSRGETITRPAGGSGVATQDYFLEKLFRERAADGLTFFQRWEKSRLDGLTNDEQVLFRAHAGMRPTAIEIQTAGDDQTCIVTDLLHPESGTFIIVDRSLAGIAGRFAQYLGWIYALPHYRRIHGVAVAMPAVQDMEAADILRASASHLGWQESTAQLQDWLAVNFAAFSEALNAISPVLFEESMRRSFTQKTHVIYRLKGPQARFAKALDERPDASPCDVDPQLRAKGFMKSWDWMAGPQDAALLSIGAAAGEPVLGTVSLAADQVLLSCSPGRIGARLREVFEQFAGTRVEFAGERTDDLGLQGEAPQATPRQRELVPPALLSHARRFDLQVSRLPLGEDQPADPKSIMRAMEKSWLDTPLPACAGLTPRQAADDAAHRPTLVKLVRDRIRKTDSRQRDDGDEEYPGWMARELGLTELAVPPPPGLYPPVRPQLPALPAAPLSFAEVEERIAELYRHGPDPLVLIDQFLDEAPELADTLADLWDAEERAVFLLELMAMNLWFIFFPVSCPARLPDTDRIEDAIDAIFAGFEHKDALPTEEMTKALLCSERQPDLVSYVQASVMAAVQDAPEDQRVDSADGILIMAVLRSLADEFDRVARGG